MSNQTSTEQLDIDRQSKVRKPTIPTSVIRLAFLAVSISLFAVSLTQDGFYIDRRDNARAWSPGLALLLCGWFAISDGVFAWFANPILLFSWVSTLRKAYLSATLFAFIALGLALSFLLTERITTNEAGGQSNITGYAEGYWLWIASISAAVIGNAIAYVSDAQLKKYAKD